MKRRNVSKVVLPVLYITVSALFAILVHILMPSPGAAVDTSEFNSVLVKWFGFPFVATLYFLLLYLHIYLVVSFFGKRIGKCKVELGWRYSLVFSLMYIIAMQEIVLESSPFTSWGIDFIRYQLCIGLGDGIPVIILCMVTVRQVTKHTNTESSKKAPIRRHTWVGILVIMLLFVIEREIGYQTGWIASDASDYQLPVFIWTVIFGIYLGASYMILYPMYEKCRSFYIMVLTIGFNWIIFNSFIGMIMADTILSMIVRSGTDVVVLFIAGCLVERIFYILEWKNLEKKKSL